MIRNHWITASRSLASADVFAVFTLAAAVIVQLIMRPERVTKVGVASPHLGREGLGEQHSVTRTPFHDLPNIR